jgi:flagellar assembly protein FliH
MNSSTKPPVSSPNSARKFQFDVDFEQEEQRMRVESLRHHEQETQTTEESPVIPARIFSEDEANELRNEAMQNGLRQGRMESLQEIEQSIALLINNMNDKLEELLNADHQRLLMTQEIVIRTTVLTIKKIWPQILQKYSLELVESTIRQSMDYNSEEPRIVVRVHDTLLDEVVKRLPKLQEQQAFAGKVIVIADQSVIAGDCKIEWADGGLDRLSRTLSQQLDAALERILSSLSSSNTDPERISS